MFMEIICIIFENNEILSLIDLDVMGKLNGTMSYLGTPAGRVMRFDPDRYNVSQIGYVDVPIGPRSPAGSAFDIRRWACEFDLSCVPTKDRYFGDVASGVWK